MGGLRVLFPGVRLNDANKLHLLDKVINGLMSLLEALNEHFLWSRFARSTRTQAKSCLLEIPYHPLCFLSLKSLKLSNLAPYERHVAHTYCTELGLNHESQVRWFNAPLHVSSI